MRKSEFYRRNIVSRRWLNLRRLKLSNNPICEECERIGRVRSATEVHHIKPVESVAESSQSLLMYDYNNLMSLCSECHVKMHIALGKNTKEDNIKRNEEKVKDAIERFLG